MIHSLIFDGKCSRDFGLYISGSGVFNAPERDMEAVEVPGRNGALILDNRRYRNITVAYPAFIRQRFPSLAGAARSWLLRPVSYRRLEDTYHPEYFRLGRFSGPLDFDVRFQNSGGETTLYFDCKPQRFLKSGEHPITLTGPATLRNPTDYEALPLITVYGSGAGALDIDGTAVRISAIDGYVTLDCDLQDAVKGAENKNQTVILDSFPTLPPGTSNVSFSGGITKIDIIPRWWTI